MVKAFTLHDHAWKCIPGSINPERMIGRARAKLAAEAAWLAEKRQRLAAASLRLDKVVAEILAS